MRLKLEVATAKDAADLVALRAAVNQRLMAQYGNGYWAAGLTEKGALFAMRTSTVYVARAVGRLIATLALSTRKPWAIDKKYFSASRRPLYLTSMAVAPGRQRKGIGRLCVDEARRIAAQWPADAIRLDAFDAEAGAGGFYSKCGFREVGRAAYRNVPLIYFEMLV
jgi:GNAT superfamily N-acetyltransferase